MLCKEAMPIMKKYINCPLCGNDRIGNNLGSVVVHNSSYSRTCKCGFLVVVKSMKRSNNQ